jgi:hypothetical protein
MKEGWNEGKAKHERPKWRSFKFLGDSVTSRFHYDSAARLPLSVGADVDIVTFQIQGLILPLLFLVVTCEFPTVALPYAGDGLAEATDATSGTATAVDACRRGDGRLGAAGVSARAAAERRRAMGQRGPCVVVLQIVVWEGRRGYLVLVVPCYQLLLVMLVSVAAGSYRKVGTPV